VVRRGSALHPTQDRLLSDPQVSEEEVEALRLSALKRWGRPGEEIAAELTRVAEYAMRLSAPSPT